MTLADLPMRRFFSQVLQVIDWPLMLLLSGFMVFSVVVMLSASSARLDSQLINCGVALSLMWIVACIPAHRIMSIALPAYIVGLILLLCVEFFGETSKGAQRWLHLGVVRIQPSEIMKVAMPLMLAWYFHRREGMLTVMDFVVAGILLAMPVLLILHQPDLGTSLLVLASGVYVLFFAGLSWRLIVPLAIVFVIGLSAILVFGDTICAPNFDWPVLREYQKQRVCTLLDPSSDPLGNGFHIIQSTIAIGSGGLIGKGWLQGTQAHLSFIPERHTDFIFAVIAEEFGLIGITLLLLGYGMFFLRGFYIALNAPTLGSRLMAGSLTLILFTYVFVNMGMVSGILPVVGVPLPFISYGGTALVSLCLGIGILMSIHSSHRKLKH